MRNVVHVLTSLALTISLASCAAYQAPGSQRAEPPENETAEPPGDGGPRFLDRPGGTRHTGPSPRAVNEDEIRRLLRESYPEDLRDDGIGGHADLWIHVTSGGRVDRVRVKVPSSHPALDSAAVEVARGMEFEPALDEENGEAVAVWILRAITFRTSG